MVSPSALAGRKKVDIDLEGWRTGWLEGSRRRERGGKVQVHGFIDIARWHWLEVMAGIGYRLG